jgi:hypothetical protein
MFSALPFAVNSSAARKSQRKEGKMGERETEMEMERDRVGSPASISLAYRLGRHDH